MSGQSAIAVTKIQAKQAVLVAVITAVSSIVGTVVATKPFDRSIDDRQPSSSAPDDEQPAAPLIFIASSDSARAKASIQQCKDRAVGEMRARQGKVIASGDSLIAMELRQFGIMVMCRDKVHGASVTVASNDNKANSDLAIAMRAAVLE